MSRAGSRLCRGELSRGTNLCFSSAVSEAWRDPRGVRVSPLSPALAGTEAILQRLALRGVHALYLLHLVPPPLFACISFSRGPLPVFYCPLCFYSDVNFSMQLVLCLVLFV